MSNEHKPPEIDLREYLNRVALEGVLFVLNLKETRFSTWLVDRLFGRLLANVIDLAVEFDRRIGVGGLRAGCEFVALRCGTPAKVKTLGEIPTEGPLLLVANHPGFFDSMAIVTHLPRTDLKVVVGGVPYFNEMPHARKHIYYTDHSSEQSVQVVRNSVRHLREGGSVLIYPTGQVDPDPDYMDGAHERIYDWSKSVALMMRKAPETKLLPVTASGVLVPKYLNHPIARLQPNPRFRQRVAEFFQLYRQFGKADRPPLADPRITYGEASSLQGLVDEAGGKDIMPAVIARAQSVLANHMTWR